MAAYSADDLQCNAAACVGMMLLALQVWNDNAARDAPDTPCWTAASLASYVDCVLAEQLDVPASAVTAGLVKSMYGPIDTWSGLEAQIVAWADMQRQAFNVGLSTTEQRAWMTNAGLQPDRFSGIGTGEDAGKFLFYLATDVTPVVVSSQTPFQHWYQQAVLSAKTNPFANAACEAYVRNFYDCLPSAAAGRLGFVQDRKTFFLGGANQLASTAAAMHEFAKTPKIANFGAWYFAACALAARTKAAFPTQPRAQNVVVPWPWKVALGAKGIPAAAPPLYKDFASTAAASSLLSDAFRASPFCPVLGRDYVVTSRTPSSQSTGTSVVPVGLSSGYSQSRIYAVMWAMQQIDPPLGHDDATQETSNAVAVPTSLTQDLQQALQAAQPQCFTDIADALAKQWEATFLALALTLVGIAEIAKPFRRA